MENGFAVPFCSGNLTLRRMYEDLRNDPGAKIILVDGTREKSKQPLFYPDLEARCKPRARLTITELRGSWTHELPPPCLCLLPCPCFFAVRGRCCGFHACRRAG